MNNEVTIRAENVSKKFARSLKRAMTYGLVDVAKAALIPHRFRSPNLPARLNDDAREAPSLPRHPTADTRHPDDGLRPSEFWALRDISFDIKRGESVGLIGANGAGKSTLFSVLSGIYGPTEGRVEVKGRLQALIALGAGFHPSLSGRENIFINGAILGLNMKEVGDQVESIIEFSGLGDFIDSPVKMYSSGMLVRLGFSIAVHVDPDILLIDEVLAVGDAAFQRKCTDYSLKLAKSGKTIVTVSHNHLFIQSMCDRIIWLDHGKIVGEGKTDEMLDQYRKFMAGPGMVEATRSSRSGHPILIHDMFWTDEGNRRLKDIVNGKSAVLKIDLEAFEEVKCGRLWIHLHHAEQQSAVTGFSMYDDGHFISCSKGRGQIKVTLPAINLVQGEYYRISAGVRDWNCSAKMSDSFAPEVFTVEGAAIPCGNGIGGAARIAGTTSSKLHIPYSWASEGSVKIENRQIPDLV